MKLSISNIAWAKTNDELIYQYLADNNFDGIEIAPTRLVETHPYDNVENSLIIAKRLKSEYNLNISSMQSIWFGRSENLFGSTQESKKLVDYTQKAIVYAEKIGCNNLVFGCPKNRNMDDVGKYHMAVDFFQVMGEYAHKHGVVIALEPNPVIYNTNFLNTTEETIQFVKEVNSKGLQVNMDLGTIIWNDEDLNKIMENIKLIHHIHISEPNLVQIEKRKLHSQLKNLLVEAKYDGYVSIEMKNFNDLDIVKNTMNYVIEVMR